MTSPPASPPGPLGPDPGSGVSMRLANVEDMGALQEMYSELLAVLGQHNPAVDVTHRLQTDWIEKPDDLFAWIIERGGDTASTAGFALVCGERYAHALGSTTDYLLYEFLVVDRARRSGVGQGALDLLLGAFPGQWSLDVLPGNEAAISFWSHVLAAHKPQTRDRVDEDGVTFVRYTFESVAKRS